MDKTAVAFPGVQPSQLLQPLLAAAAGSAAMQPYALADYRPGSLYTPELREKYAKDGFFVIKRLVPEERLEKYKARFQQICRHEVNVPGLLLMKDISLMQSGRVSGEDLYNKIQDFQYDDELFDYCQLPQITTYVKDIIASENILAVHTMLINKPPDPGTKTSRHPLHQDLHYFPFRPADRIVCAWTAMEKVTRANGCLVVVPGSHKGDLIPHEYPDWEGGVNIMYHGIQNFDPNAHRVYLEMEPGDTVFFHSLLIHGSGSNLTKGYRKAISCHYAAGECYYIDIRGTSQQIIIDEAEEFIRKKFGSEVQMDYADTWRLRSRVVRGDRCNM